MKILEKIQNPFGGIDEKAMTDQLESICGIEGSFKLLDIMRESQQAASGNRYTLNTRHHIDYIKLFKEKAKFNGFSKKQIDAFLDYQSCM